MTLASPFKRGLAIRKRLVNEWGEVLCVDFSGTKEGADTTKIKGLARDREYGRTVFRHKVNIKEISPKYREQKGLPPFDFSDEKAIMEILKRDENFDIPLWFLRKAGDSPGNIHLYDIPLIYQLMGCNFCDKRKTSGCVQCFVDNESNVPDTKRGVWLSADNVVASFENMYRDGEVKVLRISGGEPTLALDHVLSVLIELDRRGLPILLQFDTNLSTGRLIERFENEGIFPKDILHKIAVFNPGVLVSLKGTSDENLQQNTQARITVEDQIYSLKKFVEAGVDVYPYIYTPDPFHLKEYILRMESIFENFLLKTHVVMTKSYYGPTKERLNAIAKVLGKNPELFFQKQARKWDDNYKLSCGIMDEMAHKLYGLEYKELERPGIKLKVK